ncbi:MAG: YhdP family protein [Cycloclasticus sp.]
MSKVRLFGHSLLWLFTVSIAVLAVLVVGVRFVLTDVASYKNDLEVYLSQQLGGQVHLQDMSAKMDGFKPQLSLTGITLDELNKPAKTLSIGEIRVSFNPLGFITGHIVPSQIIIVNTSIKIKRFADGHVSIDGLSSDKKDENTSGDFSWLLEGEKFEVVNSQITWQDDMLDLPDVSLNSAHIIFQNNGQEHALKVTAKLPEETGGEFVLAINLMGDVLSTNDWQAKGYFKGKGIDVAKHLSRLKIDGLSINQGEGDIELWSTWEAARLSQVKGNVLVRKAHLKQDGKELDVTNVTGNFDWQKTLNGWKIKAQDFAYETKANTQEKSQFSAKYSAGKDGDLSIKASAQGIDLAAISDLLQHSTILGSEPATLLDELNVRGLLKELNVSINSNADSMLWAACGALQGFSSDVHKTVPAINNFTGEGCSTQDEGWLSIDTNKGSAHFKNLFREPILVDKMAGQLTWTHNNDAWVINSDYISLNSPHISTQLRINMRFPEGGQSPTIDLQSIFGQADARFTSLYLPVGIMNKGLVDWLGAAFVEGQTKGGGLLLKGQLSDFPYRQKAGLFQVLFSTKGVQLHYADQWPDVMGAAANIEFKNEGMSIIGSQGIISGNKTDYVLVDIADFKRNKYLNISGKIDGDISGLYTFFKQSPIKEHVGTLLDHSAVSGPAIIDLNIQVPLEKKLNTKVSATARILGGALSLPDVDLVISHIQGEFNYGAEGLSGQSIKAQLLEQKLEVDITDKKNSTVILAKGQMHVASVAKKYPSDLWQYISGNSLANIKVSLPHSGLTGGGSSTITVNSNLKGIAVDLPEPAGKQKNTIIPSKVEISLGEKSLPIKVSYGNEIKAKIQFSESSSQKLSFEKADIHFGKTEASLPATPGVSLSGTLDKLDVKSWINVISAEQKSSVSPTIFNQFKLHIKKLNWLDAAFDELRVMGRHKDSAWSGEVGSPLVVGRYHVPDNLTAGNKISLELETLTIPSNEEQTLSNKESPVSPSDVPNIDITSKQFFIGESELGQLELRLRQKENGMIIESLSLKSDRDDFQADGAWEVSGKQSATALKGRLNSQSLGLLLKDTELTSKLKDAPVDIYFDLNWPGEPQAFSKEHLNGYAEATSGQGRLLDVEPGIGRIFGLLSLSTLQRRLQLDFSDLVQKGLSFDKIKGRVVILDGEAQTNRFYLESPSARLDFQGKVSLANEELDQIITVTPKTTESLPLAGAIAGGPLVGAAVFIAQKIAGKTVNKLVGYQYRVTGPWKDPKIKQISQPGGKIFGMMDNVLSPVFNAAVGQLPFSKPVLAVDTGND